MIDRESLVRRHTVELTEADASCGLTVGNGDFAFTADITGMQTFTAFHDPATTGSERPAARYAELVEETAPFMAPFVEDRDGGYDLPEQWQAVQDGLACPHQEDGRYTAIATEPYLCRDDHPSMLRALGVVPATPLIDPTTMEATLADVRDNWESAWGWDFPVTAPGPYGMRVSPLGPNETGALEGVGVGVW